MTKQELTKLIIKHFYDKENNRIDLCGLDFSKYNIDISEMKAKIIYQERHTAEEINQSYHNADYINQSEHGAKGIEQFGHEANDIYISKRACSFRRDTPKWTRSWHNISRLSIFKLYKPR